ncbi:MAG: TonB-dependent receptor plug domain-containing protein [Alphaproteobacteria bacterium]|nr:TonB-dependent receptor plug domain-containing protein [Alphaproteobacteria bacterium]
MFVLWLVGTCVSLAAAAPDEGEDEVVIEEEAPADSASSRTLDRAEVETLPARSADDLLAAMPGLHRSAHGGQGKAYQYFLRGFDAVHGGDLAVDLEGVPLNEVSNVHAHGYLDLHFVPTALVSGLTLQPGPFAPAVGDFAIAGSASYRLGLTEPGLLVEAGAGTDRSVDAATSWRPGTGDDGDFVALEGSVGRGVGEARDWGVLRGGVGQEVALGGARARAWVLAGAGRFSSPGVLREDDLQAGRVGFYDAYPGSGGGRSLRVLGALQAWGGDAERSWRATLWGGRRTLVLTQNFTGWYVDEAHGDGTSQQHRAWSTGVSLRGFARLGRRAAWSGGVDSRLDDLDHQEVSVEVDGTAWAERSTLSARQGAVGGWTALALTPARWLRLAPALRGDAFVVARDDEALAWAPVLAPRVTMAFFEQGPVAVLGSAGRGYRSPDVRGAGSGGRAPVATADSAELGLRTGSERTLRFRLAAFGSRVSDEIVFDHVAARYLATGATRRVGLDAGVVCSLVDSLELWSDLTLSDGRYAATGEPIPYAPRLLAVAGLRALRIPVGRNTLAGGLRGWLLGPRPLPDGSTSRVTGAADLTATLDRGPWGVGLSIDNLLGLHWRDGEFVYPSHWDPDAARSELSVRHITAGSPPAAHLSLHRRL